mmetsp:Transcript_61814/g.73292  ORF Transcript_61814/g.73292 Transcript_61814/m.73292 type:complete len:81 (-) Transcript_61814:241-483(-)
MRMSHMMPYSFVRLFIQVFTWIPIAATISAHNSNISICFERVTPKTISYGKGIHIHFLHVSLTCLLVVPADLHNDVQMTF